MGPTLAAYCQATKGISFPAGYREPLRQADPQLLAQLIDQHSLFLGMVDRNHDLNDAIGEGPLWGGIDCLRALDQRTRREMRCSDSKTSVIVTGPNFASRINPS